MAKQHEHEVSAAEAARMLNLGLAYVYSLVWSGKLPSRKVEGRWRIPLATVEARLKQRETNG